MPRRAWAPFEFEAHWVAFWTAWSSPEVQSILEWAMVEWCREHAHRQPDGSAPTWRTGQPLWHLSITEFWIARFVDLANARMDALYPCDAFQQYKRTMRARGLPHATDPYDFYTTVFSRAWEEAFDDVLREKEPRAGTLDSLVLFGGRNYVFEALAATATRMFPGERVCVAARHDGKRHGTYVILPDRRRVFDLNDAFLAREGHRVRYPRGFKIEADVVRLTDQIDNFFIYV